MHLPNSLAAPCTHSLQQIIALFGNNSADSESFRHNYVLEFHIGMKIYGRLPLLRFPLWGHLSDYIEQDGEIEVQYRTERLQKKPLYTVKSLRLSEPWAYDFKVPQLILPRQYFAAKLI